MDVEKDWNKLRNSNFNVLFVCQFLGCVGELIHFQETLSRGRDQSACQHIAHLQQSELVSNSLALLAPSELELSGRKMCQFVADINPILRNQLVNIHSKLCLTGVIWSHFWNLKPATEQQTPQRKFLYNCAWIPYSSIFRCPSKSSWSNTSNYNDAKSMPGKLALFSIRKHSPLYRFHRCSLQMSLSSNLCCPGGMY